MIEAASALVIHVVVPPSSKSGVDTGYLWAGLVVGILTSVGLLCAGFALMHKYVVRPLRTLTGEEASPGFEGRPSLVERVSANEEATTLAHTIAEEAHKRADEAHDLLTNVQTVQTGIASSIARLEVAAGTKP